MSENNKPKKAPNSTIPVIDTSIIPEFEERNAACMDVNLEDYIVMNFPTIPVEYMDLEDKMDFVFNQHDFAVKFAIYLNMEYVRMSYEVEMLKKMFAKINQ